MIILKGDAEIKNVNITDSDTTSLPVGDLKRDTAYTVKVFARNAVFEGPAGEKEVRTKYEGNKMRYCGSRFWSLWIIDYYYMAMDYYYYYTACTL